MTAGGFLPLLELTVEVAAGERIYEAAEAAVALANKLEVIVWFKFNGISCCARPGDVPGELAAAYYRSFETQCPTASA